jgi:nitrate reductase delta subunit
MHDLLNTLALAYQYPTPGSTKRLWDRLKALPASNPKSLLERFLNSISELTLSEREELYTRTLDLTPLTAPYIAYSVYGEDYRRGSFMAAMNRELAAHEVNTAGELPDHLIPVLRYLAVASEPLTELVELVGPALKQVHHTLKVLEKNNPYLLLIEATQQATEELCREQRAKSRELNTNQSLSSQPSALSPQHSSSSQPSAFGPLQSFSPLLPKGGRQ